MSKNRTVATIITADFRHYAFALHDSLINQDENIKLAVFISKGEIDKEHQKRFDNRDIELYFLKDLLNFGLTKKLWEKYSEVEHDAFRWGMKPVFINYLLQKFEKVIYLDSDLYFFNEYTFLWKQLDSCKVLLSPHWRSSDPVIDLQNFKLNFIDGIYNAGFIGASKGAELALDYWGNLCLFKCNVSRNKGFYVDQRYLDILPTRFEGIGHIKHKGCNVANWNQVDCVRSQIDNKEVIINNKFPIIFIHFTNSFLRGVLLGKDKLLLPYLKKYRDNLLEYSQVDIIEEYFEKGKFKKSRSENDFNEQPLKTSSGLINNAKKYIKKAYKKLS